MKYQFIVWLGLSLLLSIPLRAQNSIDRMVEEYSAIGGSKFTSAVERDPNTRRVKKATRVYLLKYDDRAYHFSDATITIVIVPK